LPAIKATKGRQATREADVLGVLLSSSPVRRKKKITKRTLDRRLNPVYLFSFSNFPFGFHALHHLSSSQKLKMI